MPAKSPVPPGTALLIVDDDYHGSPWVADIIRAFPASCQLVVADPRMSLAAQVAGADVVIDVRGAACASLAEAGRGRVKLWQLTSVGHDHHDIRSVVERGIPFATCAGATSATGLAELALTLAVLVVRRYHPVVDAMRAGRPSEPVTGELSGRTLLLIGLGASARALARRAVAFDMAVTAVRRGGPDGALAQQLGLAQLGSMADLDAMLSAADVVSLHVPLTETTRGILDRDRLARLKRGGVVVNVSRGGLVDEAALADLVRTGHLAGAGLDVLEIEPVRPDEPLLAVPEVVLTPHLAGRTDLTSRRRGEFVANNVERVLRGQEPLSRVTLADLEPRA